MPTKSRRKTTTKTAPAESAEETPAQLDWNEPEPAAPEPRPTAAAGRIDPQKLPRVEESVSAQNLQQNCQCSLTPGCTGRIRVMSCRKRTVRDPESGEPTKHITEQYLRCTKCLRMPVNPRRMEQNLVDTRLFDRHRRRKSDNSFE